MKANFVVLTAKRSKGEFEGRHYESTRLTVISDDVVNNDVKGLVITDYKGDYSLYTKIMDVPGEYELDISIRPNGVLVNDIVKFIKPVKFGVS
jgi:hypothetical protein